MWPLMSNVVPPNSAVKNPVMHVSAEEMAHRAEWGNIRARGVIARSGRDRAGAVSGLNLGPPSADESGTV